MCLLLFTAFAHLLKVLSYVVRMHKEPSAFREWHVVGICLLPFEVEVEVSIKGDVQAVHVAAALSVANTLI